MPDAAPTLSAERQRRHRERRRRGICMVPVELSEDHINVLTATGWLAPETRAIPTPVGVLSGEFSTR